MNEALETGVRLLQQGRLREARGVFEGLLARDPEHSGALHHLGLTALLAGEPSAVDMLRRALDRAPDNAVFRTRYGQALQAAGRLDEAIAEYRRAIATAPDHAFTHNVLGAALVDKDCRAEAEQAFRRALELQPRFADAASNLATLLERRADYVGAEQACRQALEADPRRADAWNDLGNCLQSQRRNDEALAAYRRAETLAPRSGEVACNVGTMLRATGALAESVVAFERAVALAPRFADAHYHLAAARLAAGEVEAAIDSTRRSLEIEPHAQESIALLAFLLHEAGREDEARRLVDFERFVRVVALPTPPGYADMRAFNRALSEHVLAHPSLVYEPYGASTRRGRHSADLLAGDKGPAAALEKLVQAAVGRYIADLPAEDGNPFLARRVSTCRLVIQANLLEPGGFLVSHVHPASWLSGAYYTSLPEGLGAGGDERAGWLEFGRPPALVELRREPRVHAVRPAEGTLVLFPSYFYHGTVPLPGEGTRISVGIDLIPSG